MNRAELEIKGVEALLALLSIPRMLASPNLGVTLRKRAAVVIDAVEDDIRRDERNRITSWLRECSERFEFRFHERAIEALATELDRRPIEDVEPS